MKKTLLYSLAVLASITLASCKGDYDDWANPQANEQEASAAQYGITFTPGSEAVSSMSDNEDGIINLVQLNSTNDNVTGYTLRELKVNNEVIKGEINGNSIQVSAKDLEKFLCDNSNSRACKTYDLKVESKVSINLESGDVISINKAGETAGKLTTSPVPAIDENGYYMLGDINGKSWDATDPQYMNKIADGVYQLKVTTEKEKNWFKFYESSKYKYENGDWTYIDSGALGCKENGCEDGSGYIYFNGDSWGKLQTMVIPGAGTWIVTLDMNNLTYSFAKPVLYMAGNANGWSHIDYLSSEDAVKYTGYMFLDGSGFKFCSQPNWDGTNYGGAFFGEADDNIIMTQPAGYYKVDIDLSEKKYELTPITSIGIIGDATVNGWSGDDIDMTYVPYNKETKEGRYWEVKAITLKTGVIKFRANDDWAINWGGELDNLTSKGNPANIAVEEGTYDIKLYPWADGYAKCEMTKK